MDRIGKLKCNENRVPPDELGQLLAETNFTRREIIDFCTYTQARDFLRVVLVHRDNFDRQYLTISLPNPNTNAKTNTRRLVRISFRRRTLDNYVLNMV